MYQVIQKTMKSDMTILNDVVNHIISNIKKPLNLDCLFDIRLILSELIVNGIIHGNNSNIEKNIDISLTIYDDKLEFKIKDEGKGFKYIQNSNTDNLNESGRGLFLVEGLSDELKINNNYITCIKNI